MEHVTILDIIIIFAYLILKERVNSELRLLKKAVQRLPMTVNSVPCAALISVQSDFRQS